MNVWNFTGRIGNDAEQRHTAGGTPVLQFSVAVTSGYGQKKETTWARCSLYGKRGESLAPYLLKGGQVGVSGEVTLREWDGKDGSKQKSLEVNVNDVTLLDSRGGAGGSAGDSGASQGADGGQPSPQAAPAGGDFGNFDDDQDIPF